MIRVLLISLAATLVACDAAVESPPQPSATRVTPVILEQPVPRDVLEVLSALGTVESLNSPTLSAETAGQVTEIVVREGDTVVPGQLLASLDATLHAIESSKAEAETRRLDALVANQANEVERLQRLRESQSVSRDRLEDEQTQLEMLRAQRDIAQGQYAQARYMESKTRIEAPIAGVVTRRHISRGEYITAGQPLFDLVSVDRLRTRVAFPEHNRSVVAVGKPVRLTSPGIPGVVASGLVTTLNPQINPQSRAIETTIEFDNPGNWMPGASADVTLIAESRMQSLTVSERAVVNRAGQQVLFVARDDTVRAVPVTTGWREAGWVEISGDLSTADHVVTDGANLLSDGSRIRVESTVP